MRPALPRRAGGSSSDLFACGCAAGTSSRPTACAVWARPRPCAACDGGCGATRIPPQTQQVRISALLRKWCCGSNRAGVAPSPHGSTTAFRLSIPTISKRPARAERLKSAIPSAQTVVAPSFQCGLTQPKTESRSGGSTGGVYNGRGRVG